VSHPVSGGDASLAKHPASWVWRLALSQAFRPVRMSLVHKSVHETVVGVPGRDGAVRSVGFMLDRLPLPPLPTLRGERIRVELCFPPDAFPAEPAGQVAVDGTAIASQHPG
jgi:hypothetical protein